MSLLMDALKKAEKAKQGPNSVFGDPPPAAPATTGGGPPTIWPELTIDPKPAELEAELGLTQPAAKPAPQRAESAAKPLALDPLPAPTPMLTVETPAAPPPRAADPVPIARPAAAEAKAAATNESADRLAAKRVFTSKQPGASSNPRKPFYAVLGSLLLVGLGGVYYVWTEIQGPASLAGKGPATSATGPINSAPATPAQPAPAVVQAPISSAAPAPAAPPLPAPAEATGPAATAAAGPQVTRSPLPPASVAPAPLAPAVATAAESPAGRPAVAAPGAQRDEAAPPPNPPAVAAMQAGRSGVSARGGTPVNTPANLRITRDRPGPGVDPGVSAGYAALAEGNLDAAREHYNRALEADNTNRDALLGLAAIALRSGRRDVAENMYRRVLELQPRDPYATAQLTALHNSADTASAESRVKSLLANEREPVSAAPLQFALGNQMAAQGRWAEAQQAYFTAYTAESDNPDYCYNLAVSLDQLHQVKLAQDFYAKAIALSSNRRAGFDPARAKARLEQLANTAK